MAAVGRQCGLHRLQILAQVPGRRYTAGIFDCAALGLGLRLAGRVTRLSQGLEQTKLHRFEVVFGVGMGRIGHAQRRDWTDQPRFERNSVPIIAAQEIDRRGICREQRCAVGARAAELAQAAGSQIAQPQVAVAHEHGAGAIRVEYRIFAVQLSALREIQQGIGTALQLDATNIAQVGAGALDPIDHCMAIELPPGRLDRWADPVGISHDLLNSGWGRGLNR